jgi:hypothetical protein
MTGKPRSRGGIAPAAGLAALVAVLLLAVLGGTAIASPTNTALPTISPSQPKVTKLATTTTGTWNSTAPVHWSVESTQLKEGEKVAVTAQGGLIAITSTIGGISGSVACETSVAGTLLENPSGGGSGVGSGEITYKNCKAEGGWAACTASFGSATAINLELSTVTGKPKIAILPVGENLGVFTLSGCQEGLTELSPYKMFGVINGFYSNAASQIEFNPETTFTGALRLRSKVGPKASATGTIGLATGKGGNVGADSLTYTYGWKRCSPGCTEIPGATSSTYTPVPADQGNGLKSVVTATDSTGSTTVESLESNAVTASLSWYACGKWGEPGVFEDASCTKSGASNPYSWLRPSSTSFTSSNTRAGGEISPYVIMWSSSGVEFKIECATGSGSGTLSNSETQAKVEGYALTLSGCYERAPGSCSLKGTTLTFNTLKASSPKESASVLKPELLFEPSAGTELAPFTITGCGSGGNFKFIGSFPATMYNEGSFIGTTWGQVNASGLMRFQTATGPAVGMETVNRVLSEGTNPVKLDIAP